MENGQSRHVFRLEINSLEDFIKFVSVIREKDIDPNKIEDLANKLGEERIKLTNAVNQEKK